MIPSSSKPVGYKKGRGWREGVERQQDWEGKGDRPVKICWKASSTLVESNADVSINDKLFFSTNFQD